MLLLRAGVLERTFAVVFAAEGTKTVVDCGKSIALSQRYRTGTNLEVQHSRNEESESR